MKNKRKKGKKEVIKPIKPPAKFSKKALPKTEEQIEKLIEKSQQKAKNTTIQKRIKDDNKSVALGTSKINYCDPRISVAWCKRNELPVSKVFPKTLIEKFPWAMGVEDDFKF